MTPEQIALELLETIAKVAPGVLAALFSKQSDAEALAHCRESIARIPRRPAASAIDDGS